MSGAKIMQHFLWIFFRQWELIPSLGHMNYVVQTYKPVVRILVLGIDLKFLKIEIKLIPGFTIMLTLMNKSFLTIAVKIWWFIVFFPFCISLHNRCFFAANQSFSKWRINWFTDSPKCNHDAKAYSIMKIASFPLWCNVCNHYWFLLVSEYQ